MIVGKAQDTFNRRPFLKIAVMGASGTGKTEWAARSPRPLILLTEPQGIASIFSANPEANVIHIESWEDFRTIFDKVKTCKIVEVEGQSACLINIQGQDIVYQTLVVDSFTDLQRLAINKLSGVESGLRDRLDLEAGTINMSIDKWGQITSCCETVWAQQRALPCNTVFLYLATDFIDDQQVKTTIPMLSGQKLPFSMGQYFNAVGLSMVRKSGDGMQHVIRWQNATSAAITKPAPGFPAVTLNTRTEGQTTLGSLLLHSYPDLVVAHESGDNADFVTAKQAATSTEKQVSNQEESNKITDQVRARRR